MLTIESGAAASIGAYSSGGYGYNYSFVPGFLESLSKSKTLGEMYVYGLIYLNNLTPGGIDSFNYFYINDSGLLGDPALRIDADET